MYFAAFKKHISLFITPWYAETVPPELAQYHAGKATYQFPLDTPIPFTLIEDTVEGLVRARDPANQTTNKPG